MDRSARRSLPSPRRAPDRAGADAGARGQRAARPPAPAACSTPSPRSAACVSASSYEGQAAMELEWAADGRARRPGLRLPPAAKPRRTAPSSSTGGRRWRRCSPTPRRRRARRGLARRFHAGLAAAIVAVAAAGRRAARSSLTGGCFQNARLTEARRRACGAAGFEPVWHRRVPPNDGGIALGQAVWAAWPAPGRRRHVPSGSRTLLEHHRRRPAHPRRPGRLRRHRQGDQPRLRARGRVGDYVLVHVGFAITVIDEAEARARLRPPAGDRRARRPRRGSGGPDEVPRRIPRRGRRRGASPRRSRRTVTRPWTLMEVCGGQTHAIVRFGLDELLPAGSPWSTGRAARSASRRSSMSTRRSRSPRGRT